MNTTKLERLKTEILYIIILLRNSLENINEIVNSCNPRDYEKMEQYYFIFIISDILVITEEGRLTFDNEQNLNRTGTLGRLIILILSD